MEMTKEFGLILGRILTIFPLMLFITLFMGRRAIGEMPVFDFLIILALGSIVGADIADPHIEHLPTAIAILMIGLLQKIFTLTVIRFRWFGKLVTFEPIIIIHDGKIIHRNLKKAHYSIDNVLQMLREKKIFQLEQIHLAVIEANGKLSILEKEISLKPSISYPLIREGQVEKNILRHLHLEPHWVEGQLNQAQIQLNDIFLATINEQYELHITKYTEKEHHRLPPIHH